MRNRLNIFNKIIIMVILLLIPILILYSFSNRITNQVIETQIESSNLNQLSFFLHQLDSTIENLSMFPVIFANDPHIREFIDKRGLPEFERLKEQSRVTEKLGLQSVSSSWSNDLTLVLPGEKRIVSSNIFLNGSTSWLWDAPIHTSWMLEKDSSRGAPSAVFVREISEPANVKYVAQANAVLQVRFPLSNVSDMLDVYKRDKNSDPFLFHQQLNEPILNSTASITLAAAIVQKLRGESLRDQGQERMIVDKQEYLVSFVRSQQLGWYLVDYVPVQEMLSPITKTRKLFYGSIGLLLILSLLASFMLYRNVQIPLIKMIQGVKRMTRGDLSARIEYRSNNEFDYLITRFNEMGEQIQLLIEDVYAEKLRSREATLKQLQSQINPHFLYNSLFFIINSAMLDDRDAVVEMSQNLAEYYRYTTRTENQSVKLKDELELVTHYLNIQNMRMQRLEYSIEVPDEMLTEIVPRLFLQPIVENALIHGIEQRVGGGCISIRGKQDEQMNQIVVDDNGKGLSEEELRQLRIELEKNNPEDIGCGTWNVHQRLQYQFGKHSGLTFHHRPGGGLRVILSWNRNAHNVS